MLEESVGEHWWRVLVERAVENCKKYRGRTLLMNTSKGICWRGLLENK